MLSNNFEGFVSSVIGVNGNLVLAIVGNNNEGYLQTYNLEGSGGGSKLTSLSKYISQESTKIILVPGQNNEFLAVWSYVEPPAVYNAIYS